MSLEKEANILMDYFREREDETTTRLMETIISFIPTPEMCVMLDLEDGYKRAYKDYTGCLMGYMRMRGLPEALIKRVLGEWYRPQSEQEIKNREFLDQFTNK